MDGFANVLSDRGDLRIGLFAIGIRTNQVTLLPVDLLDLVGVLLDGFQKVRVGGFAKHAHLQVNAFGDRRRCRGGFGGRILGG